MQKYVIFLYTKVKNTKIQFKIFITIVTKVLKCQIKHMRNVNSMYGGKFTTLLRDSKDMKYFLIKQHATKKNESKKKSTEK